MNSQHNPHPQVAIIGAGIAGLAAAYELKQQGIPSQVFERAEAAGGRMVTSEIDGLLFDAGADFFSDNYSQMKHYAQEFGIPWVPYEKYCAQRFMRNGKTHILHLRGIHDILNQPLLSVRARIALLKWLIEVRNIKPPLDFFDLSSLPAHLDSSTAAEYLSQSVHHEINDYIADPFTGAMQFHRTDEISVAALTAILQMMISPTKKFAPRYTTGGINQISNALAKEVSVAYSSLIVAIKPVNGSVRIQFENQEDQVFKAVVLATPAYTTKKLLAHPTNEQNLVLDAAAYAATITIALKVPLGISDISHCTYVPYKENTCIGSYTFEENKSSAFAGADGAVMNIYLREETARKLMDQPDAVIYAHAIEELSKVCPEVRGHETAIRGLAMYRWPNAMPKFNYRYISTVREFVLNHQGQDNIYLAGDYLNAPWTEGAARSGIRVSKLIADYLKRSGNSTGKLAISSSSVGAVLPL